MLKAGYANGSHANVLIRNRTTRTLLLWFIVAAFLLSLYLVCYQPESTPPIQPGQIDQTSVLIHKTAEEIDVLPWPEDRWYEGPRNESELEKAALIMLVRYRYPPVFGRKLIGRNSELHPARSAMREVEDRFNKRFGYPWVFVNDEPFTDEYQPRSSTLMAGSLN